MWLVGGFADDTTRVGHEEGEEESKESGEGRESPIVGHVERIEVWIDGYVPVFEESWV